METSNMTNGFGFRRLSHLDQTRQIAKLNRLKSIQGELQFWEQKGDNYKRTIEKFKEYVDCLHEFNHPRALVNAYIRMGKYCENMGDRLLAQDTYKMALDLEKTIDVDIIHIKNLKSKINSLTWYR